MVLKKELCGDYVLIVTGTVDVVITNEVTHEELVNTSITDEYTFSVDDGIYTIVIGDDSVMFIENCALFECIEKMLLSVMCEDCNGEYAQSYRFELNQFLWLLDDVMLLLMPTWINTFYGYSPEEIADKQDSIELSQVWDTMVSLAEVCGCTDTPGTDRIYPFIFYSTDMESGSAMLSDINDFLVAGQNKLYDFLKSGYSYELYGYDNNTYIVKMNMIHYLLLWMIMYYIDRRDDLAWNEVYTDEEYEDSYEFRCIEATFLCEDINIKPMIATFDLIRN